MAGGRSLILWPSVALLRRPRLAPRARPRLRTSRRPALTLLRTTLTQLVNLIVCIQIRLAAHRGDLGRSVVPSPNFNSRGVDAPRATAGKAAERGAPVGRASACATQRVFIGKATPAAHQCAGDGRTRHTLSRLRPRDTTRDSLYVRS
ncbi:hypothetical protein EVAR_100688_1 [Eumeta japonica]|uniref:Uncharacterized protein n=1 Tax=Eumeta variegata TaxID=151549 RepID=A0A4C1ZMY0_EUMVA|nr:hypothetical protein EVAR_100688_1 [Eumeta japonica]